MRNLRGRSFCAVSKLLSLAGVAVLTASALHAQTNAVYVESNISSPNGNSILGYSNDGFGNLTPLPGSPYLTKGSGWAPKSGTGLAFQQDDDTQIVTNAAGTLMFAVNGRSNTISAFTINGNGSLTLVGTPLHSGGSQPASISLLEGALQNGNILVVVINKSSDPGQTNQAAPNMVSFTSTPAGVLTANATSKIVYPKGSSPSQAVVGKGKLVMVDEFLASPSQIGMYRIHSNGTFDTITSVPVPQGATLFLGLVASPVGNYLYAALPEQSLIAIYSYDTTTGAMTLVSTVATTGLLPCWLDVSKDGTRLYSGDTESSSISVFDVSNPTAPAFLQKLVLTNEVGNGQPWNVRIDPTGKFLYAVTGVGLHAINIQPDGTLLELATPTLLDVPSNTFPYGLATVLK